MNEIETTATAPLPRAELVTTTITEFSNGVVETISRAVDQPGSRLYTREKRYASRQVLGQGTACVDLKVSMADDVRADGGRDYYVRWSSNRGRAWGKAFRKTCGTEAEALAFAATKWEVMLAWLAKVEPVAAAPLELEVAAHVSASYRGRRS